MKVPWPDPRCIVCLGTPIEGQPMTARSDAHVLPKAVGGELSALCLCKRCNNEMGRMEAILACDIKVRRAVKYHLQARLPKKLAMSILSGEEYFVDHEQYGRVEAYVDDDGFLAPKQSVEIKDDKNTLAQALAELDRIGATEEHKQELREESERAEPGAWIDVRPGYRIQRSIDWSDVSFKESLNDPIVGHEVPLGIAYLYLALCLRNDIYTDALSPVRAALKAAIDGDPSKAREMLPLDQRMGTRKVEPVHLLRARNDRDGVCVVFQVFYDLAWSVHFPGVVLGGEQTLYQFDLEHDQEMWATRLTE